jgi:hypothetical protein
MRPRRGFPQWTYSLVMSSNNPLHCWTAP